MLLSGQCLLGISLILLSLLWLTSFGGANLPSRIISKRAMDNNAQNVWLQALAQIIGQNDNNNNGQEGQKVTDPLRSRFSDIAAFSYSLLSTYNLLRSPRGTNDNNNFNSSNSSWPNALLAQMAELIPDKYKAFFGPPNSSEPKPSQAEIKDLRCVDKCIEEVELQMMDKMNPIGAFEKGSTEAGIQQGLTTMAIGAFSTLNCSDEIHGRDCLAKCGQQSGGTIYTDFLIGQLNWFIQEYCPFQTSKVDVLDLLKNCQLSRIPQVAFSFTFNSGKEFTGAFNQAQNDQQKCSFSAVKRILFEEFANSLSTICEEGKQAELMRRMMLTTGAYSLAQNTQAAIFNRCPGVFTRN